MRIENFDLDRDVLVVAEIGNNHEGSYTLAEELVGLAAEAGAGAVKFQTFRAEYFVSSRDTARFNRLKSFELSRCEFERLSGYARKSGLIFISTPFDIESAGFLNNIVSAFKIASGDNDFYPLMKTIALTGKPVIMSGGFADMEGLRSSKSFIEHVWKDNDISQELAILHCVSSYPAPPGELNLAAIQTLKRELGCTIGYSDHALGVEAAVLSVALGARIVEKHFTLDKDYSDYRDHKLSADPKEMRELVLRIKDLLLRLGSPRKAVQDSEKSCLAAARRSIVAKRDLAKGAEIGLDDITWIRPSGGLPPGREGSVLGKILTRSVKMGEMLIPEILSDKGIKE